MSVFMIVNATVTDPRRFKEYAERALPLLERAGGKRIALGSPRILEGNANWKGSAIYEWPSLELVDNFWFSPSYKKLKEMRQGAADIEVIVIPGLN